MKNWYQIDRFTDEDSAANFLPCEGLSMIISTTYKQALKDHLMREGHDASQYTYGKIRIKGELVACASQPYFSTAIYTAIKLN